MPGRLVLGLNQYTHSAAACLLGPDGRMLAMQQKERLSRKKHDGGDVAELVEQLLSGAGARPRDLAMVAANNHLFRIDRFHETVAWETALYHHPETYVSPFNLLPGVPRLELSHHLAHAWSVLPFLPFDEGLIVVMDGMGSTLQDMERPGAGYVSELSLPRAPGFRDVRRAESDPYGWREAETAFLFRSLRLRRLFKRWTPETTPVFLHNYGFADMTSLGAVYSRVASHVFGDWNDCGKVMGLAPWAPEWAPRLRRRPVMRGPLERLEVDAERLRAEPQPNGWSEERNRPGYARLAADVQSDLERVAVDFLTRLRRRTGARHLALTGGVALNCVLNGRIARECGFEQVFVPPYPGDEGVAVGCAAFAWHRLHPRARPARRPLSPFGGRRPDPEILEDALAEWSPWLEELAAPAGEGDLLQAVAGHLAAGRTVGWCWGEAEFGPRALGRRSILADPRRPEMVARINAAIKKREGFRPFAPAVLAEHAAEWFQAPPPSPWMSFTAAARPRARREAPAVVHADGSVRLQTLPAQDAPEHPAGCPRFRSLIERFHALTGVPMLLNTSFNLRGEPIVESARDAAWTFLRTDLDLLVADGRIFRARPFPAARGGLRAETAPGCSLETVTSPQGDLLTARAHAWGESFDLEPEELELLQQAAAGCAVPRGLLPAARRLWQLRLLIVKPAAKAATARSRPSRSRKPRPRRA